MHKASIKVSVIVPVYNSEKYLSRCLDSIINQTLEDIEIICINDGSSDNSLAVLENFAKHDSRIKLFNQENKGQSAARNMGIKMSQGEYISFVDSDDFIDKNFLQILYDVATKNNAQIAACSLVRENERKRKTLIEYSKIELVQNITEKFKKAYIPKYCFAVNKLYSKEALIKSNILFKEDFLYEDMIFMPKALFKLKKFATVNNVFYHYWKNPHSTIKQEDDKSRADKIEAHKYLAKMCHWAGLKRNKNELVLKKEYYFFGIKVLKIYQYRATKKYCLFGLIPFLISKENI